MKKRIFGWAVCVVALMALVCAAGAVSLAVGSTGIGLKGIVSALRGKGDATAYAILFDIRLPRILLAFAVGGALSLSGVLAQGVFRNPLVEPYTLGISGGAALGVCVSVLLKLHDRLGLVSLPLSGFLGAVLIIVLVYALSRRNGILKIQGLLLTGVMISFICSSLVMLIMSISRAEDLHGIVFWIMGSLEEPNWLLIRWMLTVSVFGLCVSYLFCKDLNAISLGEEEAAHLGVNVERTKLMLFFLTSLLAGCSVAVSGVIGFVGLAIPHLVRMVAGRDYRIVLIASFLTGGAFLILCDTLSRTVIAPLELPVGVITGIVGGSLFVYALAKGRDAARGKQ